MRTSKLPLLRNITKVVDISINKSCVVYALLITYSMTILWDGLSTRSERVAIITQHSHAEMTNFKRKNNVDMHVRDRKQ